MRAESFRPPVTLRGTRITLVPLGPGFRDALRHAARDPEVSRLLGTSPGRTAEGVAAYIALLLRRQAEGTDLPFAVLQGPEERAVGVTRYLHIDRPNDSVEIGTWLDSDLWRTPVNTEIKLLLLRHAFETEGAHRVVLQTDLRNERSQRAIARLGAVREGVLRGDRVVQDGYRRSSVIFSILADEWPSVRGRLERFLERPWPGPAPAPGS
ncbi:MAG: GNAT family N-acetyltransferase [Thermoplasmata archaeon]